VYQEYGFNNVEPNARILGIKLRQLAFSKLLLRHVDEVDAEAEAEAEVVVEGVTRKM
jgi:hypothetical protein